MRLGIDCGITGALALICGRDVLECWDMPTYSYTVKAKDRKTGKAVERTRRSIDGYALYQLILKIKADTAETGLEIAIERQQPNMGAGIDSPMTAGAVMYNYGTIITAMEIASAGRSTYKVVHPVSWKTAAGLKKTSKADAIQFVQDNFDTRGLIKLQKHSGRADAVLIAYYGL